MRFPIRLVAALALTVLPAIASATPRLSAKLHRRHARVARASHPCLKAPVELVSAESTTFALTQCDGTALPDAVDRLSRLAGAPAGHRLDARLVEQLEAAVDHFRGRDVPRLVILSGYRPPSGGNYHSTGRALDFRIDGIEDQALFAFCKTLTDTGCGFYPHSSFVHMDVRDAGTGHVAWTDMSNPGEPPRFVPSNDLANPSEPRGKDSSTDSAKPSEPVRGVASTEGADPSQPPREGASAESANPSEASRGAPSTDVANPSEPRRQDPSDAPETTVRSPLPPLPPPPRDTGRPKRSAPTRDR
jgi:hypothetical protein